MHKSEIILEIEHVSKSFPGVKALDDVSFSVRRGEVHGVVGENGAGKSTLMKILSGVYQKDSGTIRFDGEELSVSKPVESMGKGLSIIYQELNLVNTMSVGENIFLGRFGETGGMAAVHKKAREILDQIESDIDTRQLVGELSIAQKQMVETAKALSLNAKLIIMDEPSTTLTSKEMEILTKLIRRLKESGVTVIYITHKLQEFYDFCDRVTVLRDGQVIGTRDMTAVTRNELIRMMVGRELENEYPPVTSVPGEVVMEVRGLNTRKLHNISFELHAGEVLGLVGLVGAGRTEIVRALFGADRKKSGEVLINGKKAEIRNPMDAKRYGIGFLTEDRKEQGLIQSFSVMDNITMASLPHFMRSGFYNRKKAEQAADRYIRDLRIKTPGKRERIMNLSGGNQQKCIVGRWLETEPQILFLDEPTRGIDVGAKYEIYVLMQELASRGQSIVMISSELDEVMNTSNRILAIADGEIRGEFVPGESTSDEILGSMLG